jgi:hypothetical protein
MNRLPIVIDPRLAEFIDRIIVPTLVDGSLSQSDQRTQVEDDIPRGLGELKPKRKMISQRLP